MWTIHFSGLLDTWRPFRLRSLRVFPMDTHTCILFSRECFPSCNVHARLETTRGGKRSKLVDVTRRESTIITITAITSWYLFVNRSREQTLFAFVSLRGKRIFLESFLPHGEIKSEQIRKNEASVSSES